jgi:uncharacterized protein with beta-barrel porin domain
VVNGAFPSSGPTTVSAGALVVSGSIANSAVTVNSGAMLATGTLGATAINASAFSTGAIGTPDTCRSGQAGRDRGGVLSECAAQILRPVPVKQAPIAVRRSSALMMLCSSPW